ncbi:MAG TPA: LysR family transcriptional regulator [Syntrophales bacterium]|jgi:molybdate transport system regulatory protein|nr:LysR family transcriptional regulator [Syntrophales bacterium]HPX56331.1 LysR family transcriptional regulator [Syntrophales bacterium]HQA82989.1 LysR family transcriptional regulator [Syntrophales bacterium]
MKLAYRLWIESDGKAFGVGPYELLKFIEKTGSLFQAAQEMHLSYRKAWDLISKSEKRLGITLLYRKVGGVSGGGSTLTQEAKDFMKRYEAFHAEAKESLLSLFEKYFGTEDLPGNGSTTPGSNKA